MKPATSLRDYITPEKRLEASYQVAGAALRAEIEREAEALRYLRSLGYQCMGPFNRSSAS